MDIVNDLKNFYDSQATKFASTRRKFWPELEHILDIINSLGITDRKIKILELGCGAGRLCKFLREKGLDVDYTGVDLSKNLLEIATMENPDNTFVCDNMVSYLENLEQNEFDLVIGVASFQHLISKKQRKIAIKNINRILKYEGAIIFINWSFSKRFLNKYKKGVRNAILKTIFSLGILSFNDIYVPWKDGNQTYKRFYHIFFLKELLGLFGYYGFKINKSCYINKFGKLTDEWQDSRNTLIFAQKDIFK